MKHNLQVIIYLTLLFFISQLVGLTVVYNYLDHEQTSTNGEVTFQELPYSIERPEVNQTYSFWYIIVALMVGTILLLILVRKKKTNLWKAWYFLSILLTLAIALSGFMISSVAFILSFILALWKVLRPNVFVHNITEVFIYGGLAAIFVPLMNIVSVSITLLFISLYDMYAVWKSKHMVELAKFQTSSSVFAGMFIPYNKQSKKISTLKPSNLTPSNKKSTHSIAILGGGDIGFPLLFSGVILKTIMPTITFPLVIIYSLVVPVTATIALFLLFRNGKDKKFYPAMPFLSIGCFGGLGILMLLQVF